MSVIGKELELINLMQVFDYGTRSFRIPDYQRGYSWEEEQRNDLLKDIEFGLSGEYSHYTGTLVAVKAGSQDNDIFEIVDGQQRLTTIVILLACIAHTLGQRKTSQPAQLRRCFLEEGSETGTTVRKFTLAPDHDGLFWQLVSTGTRGSARKESKGDQNIVDAFEQFYKWLDPKNSESLLAVYEYVTKRLGFLMYAPDNTKEIGIMFEVINNRGKPLSELEKVKNYLIYYSEKNDIRDLRKAVNSKWPEILADLNRCKLTSNEDENRFLRNCWIVFHDTNKSKSFYVYDNMKIRFPTTGSNWKQLIVFVEFLAIAARTYQKLYTREDVVVEEEIECLTHLGSQPVLASVMPLIIAVFYREVDPSTRVGLLRMIEKLNFRFYGTGIASRSDSGQGELFRLAHHFYNSHNTVCEGGVTASRLMESLREFVNFNANDQKLVKYLTLDLDESGDYYSWPWLKYFLASYEGYLERKVNRAETIEEKLAPRDRLTSNDFYHIEHIWAVGDFRIIDDRLNRNVNKRRLGNFILLRERRNISIKNKPPEEKVDRLYFDDVTDPPDTLMVRELKGLFDKARGEIDTDRKRKTKQYWHEVYAKFLDLHEEKFVNFALHRWRVDGSTTPVIMVTLDSLSVKNEIYELKYDNT